MKKMTTQTERQSKTEYYASKILGLAKDTITVRFRFFDGALSKYTLKPKSGSGMYQADGRTIYYDPELLLKDYLDEPNYAVRLLLHILFHSILLHYFREDKPNEEYWNIACDIAVEALIMQLGFGSCELSRDVAAWDQILKIRKWVTGLTADKIYRELAASGIGRDTMNEYKRLFTVDHHILREQKTQNEEILLTEEDWKKISRRVKTELKAFSEETTEGELISEHLLEATKRRTDYKALLRRFTVESEEMRINPDVFDYIYYTYGLKTYGNMPLIEPLEYAEENRVRDFVIAVDTSASCKGELVRNFLLTTYEILSQENAFSHTMNVYILECDSVIRTEEKITSLNELREFMNHHETKGYGATDFRPVFARIDELVAAKKLQKLKGVIYLTDGYGVYPSVRPAYDVVFAFASEDDSRPEVPPWAYSVILDE